MADLKLDEERARQWIAEVKNEVAAVRQILKSANEANASWAGENDSVIQGIAKVYETLDKVWTNTCKTFEEANEKIEEAISNIGKKVGEVVEDIGSVLSKIGG